MHPFIIWIGVAADAVQMSDSGILLLYFVRSSRIVNKMAVCISQMQRPGEILLFKKNSKTNGKKCSGRDRIEIPFTFIVLNKI